MPQKCHISALLSCTCCLVLPKIIILILSAVLIQEYYKITEDLLLLAVLKWIQITGIK